MTWATSPSPMTPTRSLLNSVPLGSGWYGKATAGASRRRWSDRGPAGARRRRSLDGVQHPLDLKTVGERRRRRRARCDVAHEVGDLVHERVLVAQSVARRPPDAGVGVVGFGDEDPAEPGVTGMPGAVVHVQLVHRLEVEGDAAGRAVELDPHGVLAPGGEPGRLVGRERATVGAPEEHRGVVDGDLAGLHAAARTQPGRRLCEGTALDEAGEVARDLGQALAGEELGQINDMRADVAERAGSGLVLLQPPDQREPRV